MPRRVDHHARRKQLADALMSLAATQGLEAVSLRHVAAEAGVSTGMVQHYFRTKDEMMIFALDMVMQNVQARSTAEATSARPTGPGGIVRTLLLQILPLDELRRLENHVVLAFLAYAAVKPAIAEGLRGSVGQMRSFVAEQIRAAQENSDSALRIDPDHAAMGLLALVDGLGIQVLGQHYSPDEAVAVLDTHLRLLFGAADDAPEPGDTTDRTPSTRA
ncbi:TetR/AcrR family transcriptional regulator [Plantactinospora sp. S1510]|uniref:TetR/AcrR family transcriptional regulator n=1 Tax=Plantactinospora alkalitolerans TaxID=2789879 RepID=A0ABS0GYC1_9ACTN|nr:TetR/AcrR family transcriptional regulator [Plantactinospora alkalitolerans]MBF9131194.1 TetR/AcrR family transcriptional regulator [Plantactinospora alkalitolerans]